MKKSSTNSILLGLIFIISGILNACGTKEGDLTPTVQPEQIQTMAVATFASGLTQTAFALPTDTPSPSPTVTGTPAHTDTPETSPTQGAEGQPTVSCYHLTYLSDVTIPDYTTMTAGEIFTKTWRVRNSGSCAWEIGFKLKLTYGDSMEGAALTLDKAVDPGEEIDLSIVMTAPNEPGNYQGNWRMTTASGSFFGDDVYVLIIVGESESPTQTATTTQVSESATPTITATQEESTEP